MQNNTQAAQSLWKAIWQDTVIAESDNTVVVEGNHYFPEQSIHKQYLQSSDHTTVCGWKGTANYYHLQVDGKINENAVWYYASPKPEASAITGHMAFWKGVKIEAVKVETSES